MAFCYHLSNQLCQGLNYHTLPLPLHSPSPPLHPPPFLVPFSLITSPKLKNTHFFHLALVQVVLIWHNCLWDFLGSTFNREIVPIKSIDSKLYGPCRAKCTVSLERVDVVDCLNKLRQCFKHHKWNFIHLHYIGVAAINSEMVNSSYHPQHCMKWSIKTLH